MRLNARLVMVFCLHQKTFTTFGCDDVDLMRHADAFQVHIALGGESIGL